MTETALAKLDNRVLAEARDLQTITKLHDLSTAVIRQIKRAGGNTRKAVEFQLRAERKGGQLLKNLPERRGRKKSHDVTFTKLGIDRMEANRWQTIASLDDAPFEELVLNAPRLTQGVLLHHAQRFKSREKGKQDPPALPTGQFDVIYADPPWPYEIQLRGSPEYHYPILSLEEITQEYPPPAAENSILFLWTTAPKLEEALQVMKDWGFTYRTNLAWVKPHFGTGFYFRGQHELLLLGRKGSMPVPAESDRPTSVLHANTRGHSRKPDEVYSIIERMYPQGKYLEMYARNERKGWISWGLETTSAIA